MPHVKQQSEPRTPIADKRERYLAHTDHLMMVVIDFNDGPAEQPDSPHDHPHEQISYLVEGELIFFIDGKPHPMQPGDMITVPGGVPHCVQLQTSHARVVDCFTPLRDEFLK